jgi:hypothetical protein
MKKVLLIPILTILLFVRVVAAVELSPAPTGFTWQEIPELKAAFLRPDGWFFKSESAKGTLAYFITKESIANGGEFQTGLTVNVFHLKKDSAIERGKGMVDELTAKRHGTKWSRDVGPFKEFGCLTKDTDSTGTTIMQTLTVANPKTNTLYMFIFESPESDWDAAWKIGKPILDSLAIDDGI